ncbi:MAG: 3-dehydroquinate synthase [Candidatus Diapherotrites archaeon]
MNGIKVNLRKRQDNSYNIYIENNAFSKIAGDLKKKSIGNRYAVITDSNVKRIFGKQLMKNLKHKRLDACIIDFPAGERNKRLKTIGSIQERMLANGLDRKSAVIALGGGVAGDVAGFAAASYMRGIPFIQLPTTLLAMVDSSVGGKVGVDLPSGKNSSGAFRQPEAVYIHLNALKSLPEREMRNGMAEVVKHSVMADKKLFSYLERNVNGIMGKDIKILGRVIKRNCEIKGRIVEKDELEENLRKTVNYGHTIGHALEVLTNYRKYSHGEAIAIGMNAAALISEKMGLMNSGDVERQRLLLERIGLPTKIPKNISNARILGELKKDKKARNGVAKFVLPKRIGKMHSIKGDYALDVPREIISGALSEARK